MAPPLLFNQVFNSKVFPDPSHSTVKGNASTSTCGVEISITINRAVVVTALSQPSVTVNTTSKMAVVSLLQATSSGIPKPS